MQGAVEASEETATTLANTAADVLISGGANEIRQAEERYIKGGIDAETTYKRAVGEWAAGLGKDALSGFLSGIMMGGGASVLNYTGGTKTQNKPLQMNRGNTTIDVQNNNDNGGVVYGGDGAEQASAGAGVSGIQELDSGGARGGNFGRGNTGVSGRPGVISAAARGSLTDKGIVSLDVYETTGDNASFLRPRRTA